MDQIVFQQQGDVITRQINSFPKGTKAIKTDLLWKGENHHHRVRGNFKIKKYGDTVFLESAGCELFHEEHKTLKIPKGKYRVDIVIEYDHLLEESRRVID